MEKKKKVILFFLKILKYIWHVKEINIHSLGRWMNEKRFFFELRIFRNTFDRLFDLKIFFIYWEIFRKDFRKISFFCIEYGKKLIKNTHTLESMIIMIIPYEWRWRGGGQSGWEKILLSFLFRKKRMLKRQTSKVYSIVYHNNDADEKHHHQPS